MKVPGIKKISLIGLFILIVLGLAFHFLITKQIKREMFEKKFVYSEITKEELKEIYFKSDNEKNKIQKNSTTPFKEVTPFDEAAHTWSSWSSSYTSGGVTVFDANGDGKMDLYLSKDGQNWLRATDENGVLENKPKYQRNMLYLNLGNNENGYPLFKSIDQLMENETYVEEELLVENFLFPRKSLSDSFEIKGRVARVAVSADFDGDGRQDLLVGNGLPGMFWSHEKTSGRIFRLASPIGRKASRGSREVFGFGVYLVNHEVRDNTNDQYPSSRGTEYVGSNTLFLNKGDKDNDGITEWEDVSRAAGIEGKWNTTALSVADVDLDGDLDVFVGNISDMDLAMAHGKYISGAPSQLYINQLAETGKLQFVESAKSMNVDGLYTDGNPTPVSYKLEKNPLLSEEYNLLSLAIPGLAELTAYTPVPLEINGQKSIAAPNTWATVFQDVNHDGYPDIWVGNDFEYLRLYINAGGETFEEKKNDRTGLKSNWMSFAPADYNLDGKEDLFVGSTGGSIAALGSFSSIDDLVEPSTEQNMGIEFLIKGTANLFHSIFDGSQIGKEFFPRVNHSAILPPDGSLKTNKINLYKGLEEKFNYRFDGLAPYEFSWGSVSFDVQNDGKPDLYFVGAASSRGGSHPMSTSTTNPGRLLVNTTEKTSDLSFRDLTAEHHLFNIEELIYDRLLSDGYIYRKSPTQNWSKRDITYSYDTTTTTVSGKTRGGRNLITNSDVIQTAEQGRGAITADLNNDGFMDLVVTNLGGYDSRSSKAKNLNVNINGEIRALPAHDYTYPQPTNFEPGRTRVFINQYSQNNWIKIKLIDDSKTSYNRDAIGAKVVLNNKYLQVLRAGSGSHISNSFSDIHFGLDNSSANHITIEWPDRKRTKTELAINQLKNGILSISKEKGIIDWKNNKGNAN